MRRISLVSGLLCLSAFVPGCDEPEDVAGDEGSFERFKASIPAHPRHPEVYLVEGDIKMSEDQLRAYYEQRVAARPRAFGSILSDNRHDLLGVETKLRLTYCVSTTDFTVAEHDNLVLQMRAAARDWERAGDVNFIHRPDRDADCPSAPDADINFPIRLLDAPGSCGMSAFGPSATGFARVLEATHGAAAGGCDFGTTVTILRHELGHILGLEHEHFRYEFNASDNGFQCKDVFSSTDLLLSEFDNASVMYYDWCNGGSGTHSLLTRRDAAAARYLYNLPRSGWSRLNAANATQVPQYTNYDAQTRSDIFWYAPSNAVAESFSISQAAGTFTQSTSATAAPLTVHRPLPGFFDADALTDVFLYTQSSVANNDTLMRKQAANLAFTTSTLSVTDGLYVPLVGQFSGTDRTDLFFIHPAGSGRLWESQGNGTFAEQVFTLFLPPGELTTYYTPIVGDFDGDGDSDIFMYHADIDTSVSTQRSKYWRSNGNRSFTTTDIDHTAKGVLGANTSTFFYTMTTGDFNGDDAVDILFYAPTTSSTNVVIWKNTSLGLATTTHFAAAAGTYKIFSGDFNADGRTDVFWYGQGESGAADDGDMVWLMNADMSHTTVNLGVGDNDLVPVLGDFDNDGDADIYWRSWSGALPIDRVWSSDGDGTFTEVQTFGDASPRPEGYPVGYGLQ